MTLSIDSLVIECNKHLKKWLANSFGENDMFHYVTCSSISNFWDTISSTSSRSLKQTLAVLFILIVYMLLREPKDEKLALYSCCIDMKQKYLFKNGLEENICYTSDKTISVQEYGKNKMW